MNSPAVGLRVASIVFGLVALAQLTRLLMQLEVIVERRHVPVWWSGVAVIVAAALCVWLWQLAKPAKAPVTPPEHVSPGHTTPAAP